MGARELTRACADLMRKAPPAKITATALARHAGVTPAMVNYYFADRSELMVAVATLLMDEVCTPPPEDGADPVEQLAGLVDALVAIHQKYPFLHDLLLHEVLESPSQAARALFQALASSALASFKAVIDEGVRRGMFLPIDPMHLMVVVTGACVFFKTAQPLLLVTNGEVDAAAFRADLTRLLLNGLVRPAQSEAR